MSTEVKAPVKQSADVKQPDAKALSEVANAVDILTVRLQHAHADVELAPEDLPEDFDVAFKFSQAWRLQESRPGFDVRVDLKLRGRAGGPAPNTDNDVRPPLFVIDLGVVVEYAWAKEPPDDLPARLSLFGAVNGVVNAWPYLRAEVQGMACRMGLPGITLPVFRPGRPAVGAMSFRIDSGEARLAPPAGVAHAEANKSRRRRPAKQE